MNKQLEDLNKPVAYTDRAALESLTDKNVADIWKIPHGFGQDISLYSQEYVTTLLDENQHLKWRIKEMDLLFGQMLLTMQAAIIEAEHGEGCNAGMQWIFNKLLGPGELAPDGEKDAQTYFNRESEKIDIEYSKVMEFYKWRREVQ